MTSPASEVFAASGLPVLVDQHGQAAIYLHVEGTETAITILDNTSAAEEVAGSQEGGRDKRRMKRVGILKSEVAAVKLNEGIRLDGEEWGIRAIEGEDANLTRVRLVRREAEEITRPGYRRR